MSNQYEFGAFGVGLILGALTGAVVALLIAPQSGQETRIRTREQGQSAVETVRSKVGRRPDSDPVEPIV